MEMANSKSYHHRNLEVKTYTPGKILICGGYIIINPRYCGLVFTTDTKINCSCMFSNSEQIENKNDPKLDVNNFSTLIEVFSVDFQLNYLYKVNLVINNLSSISCIQIEQIQGENNKYIYFSIFYAIYFYFNKLWSSIFSKIPEINKTLNNKVIRISITSDYRFYTYNKHEFYNNVIKSFSIKTGLGSSSALISSIVSCLYSFLNICFAKDEGIKINIDNQPLRELNEDDLTNILIASTFANNMAQNKVIKLNDLFIDRKRI
jgi:phosphomevalonate kinase